MLALLATLLLGAGALAYIILPFVQRTAAASDEEAPVDTLRERQDAAVAALRELDYERQIGKLDDASYFALRERYARQAMALLKVLEQREAARDQALERAIAARRAGQRAALTAQRPVTAARPVARQRTANDRSGRWLLGTGGGALALIAAVVLLVGTINRGAAPTVIGHVGIAQPSALSFDPAHPGQLLAAGAGGFVISTDGGARWSRLPATTPGAVSSIFGGADGRLEAVVEGKGLFASSDNGTTWQPATPAVTLPSGARALTQTSGQAPILYAATPQGVEESDDGGKSWAVADGFVNGLLPTKDVRDVVYAATSDRASLPGGGTFQGLLFAATDRGLYASNDGGRSWFARQLGGNLVALATDPRQPETLVALDAAGRLYRSQDGGQTWGR